METTITSATFSKGENFSELFLTVCSRKTDLSEAGGVHLQLESARESAAVHEEHDGEELLFGELEERRLRRGLRGVDGEVQALLAH